jgi:hypothetical protein
MGTIGPHTPTEEVDLKSTARKALLLLASLLAWLGEGYLLFNLRSRGNTPFAESVPKYLGLIAHLLPWAVGMKWWWNLRRAARGGALDAAGAEKCYRIIEDFLMITCVALSVIETSGVTRGL